MSRRPNIPSRPARGPKPLPVSFRRPAAEIATDEIEFRAALDNVIAGSKDPADVARLATAAMYCARTVQALLDDPRLDRVELNGLHPAILAGAEAIDALDKRLRAAGFAKASSAERDALAGLLSVLGELDRVATGRQQRDAMNRVVDDAARARRERENGGTHG